MYPVKCPDFIEVLTERIAVKGNKDNVPKCCRDKLEASI
jgi:hypothetical protein